MTCTECGEDAPMVDGRPAYGIKCRADHTEAIETEEGYEIPACYSCYRKARRRLKARQARRSETVTAGHGRGYRCQNDHRGPHTL